MKAVLLITILLSVVFAYAVNFDQHTNSCRVISSKTDHIDLEFTLPNFKIENVIIGGVSYQRLKTDNNDYLVKTGMPELPIFSGTIAIPYHGQASFSILSSEQHQIAFSIAYPSQSKMETHDTPESFTIDRSFYESNSIYPAEDIKFGVPQILRDFRIVSFTVQPFTYSANSKTLTIKDKISLRITFNNIRGENEMETPQFYSRSFEPIYKSMLLNYNDVRDLALSYQPERILIIRPNSTDQTFLNKFNELVNWKKQKGYEVITASATDTGTSNSSIKSYIQNLYNSTATRPDYIILVGDVGGTYSIPTWNHSWNLRYTGEGDYPYTQLAGNDALGDVFLGRMSIESTNDFLCEVAKIFSYEKTTPSQPATWLNRMLLVGDDQSSGISTQYTNRFIKELSYAHNSNYTYNEVYGGSFAALINAGINQGVGFWNYRGYIGMSGWSVTSSLVNGNKLPHAVIITCDTGSFAYTSRTEMLIRAGTAASPAGSVTAIGMSTSGTHTMLNNCLAGSIFEGLFTYDMHTMGQALLYAKLYLNSVYSQSEPGLAVAFAHICNLMGDPTVEAFKGIPSAFTVSCPTTIPNGSNLIQITVNDNIGHSVPSTNVTICQGSTVYYNGLSETNGKVYATIPENLTGQLTVTVSKPNYYPAISMIDISTEGSLVCASHIIDDDNNGSSIGNSNGQVNAGETIELSVNLKNTSSSLISDIGGDLTTSDTDVQISNISSSFNDFEPGAMWLNNQAYVFSVSASCPDRKTLHFTLQLSNGVNIPILIEVRNADLDVSSILVNDNANHILDPGETSILNLTITNNGILPLTGITGILHSNSDLVSIEDTLAVFGDVTPGGTVTCNTDAFTIHGQLQLVRGMSIVFTIDLYNATGYSESESFSLNIGQVTINDPLGPDPYGYLIYDSGDTGYPDVPTYEWVGIAPAEQGTGTLIPFNDIGSTYDEGDDNGATTILPVNLPFNFSYYGVYYQSLSVCSNGFVTFISSLNGDFRNWHLPGALGPNAMIAAFWDDLIIVDGAGVYYYFDAPQHRFIIEWYHAKNGYNQSSEETFEIILYDPSYYPTSSGDGQIKIQYNVFNNVDAGGSGSPQQGNYCTIGIKDHTGLRGLEYTFNNNYPTAAAPLASNKALLITGIPVLLQAPHLLLGETIIMDSNNNQIVEPGENISLGIRLSNMGLSPAQSIQATMTSSDSYVTIQNATSLYDPIAGQATGINKNFFRIAISSNCPNNHIINLTLDITAQGYSWQRYLTLRVTKPSITYDNSYLNDFEGNSNGQADPGEQIKVIMNIKNEGTVDVNNLVISTSCTNTNLLISNPINTLSKILPGKTMQVVLGVSLTQNAQVGTYIPIQYTITSTNASPVNGQFTVGISTTGLFDNFEANNGNFSSTDGWVWGTSNATSGHSGRNMWGVPLNGEYPPNSNATVTSPIMMIGSNSQLKFWHKYDCEPTYDGGNVSISIDGGNNYTLLTPETGYPVQSVYSLPEPCFNGNMMTWTQVVCDLSAYANQQIKLRWHFCSDSIINGQGWFIDDVELSGYITPTGIIQGSLNFSQEIPDLSNAFVFAGNFISHPDSLGSYKLYLPNGTYIVSESLPSYEALPGQSVTINASNLINTINFDMNFLDRVTHLYYQVSDEHLSMSWNQPVESTNHLIHYNILRRIDADRYQLIAETPLPQFSEDLSVIGQYTYFITTDYQEGVSAPSDTISFQSDMVGNYDNPVIPIKTALYGNYPNPFNPETHISFALSKTGNVKVEVFNIRGQIVTTLNDELMSAGLHEVIWNGTDRNHHKVSSGMYFYRLTTPGYTSTRKALLLK
jgi:hypothetical protein